MSIRRQLFCCLTRVWPQPSWEKQVFQQIDNYNGSWPKNSRAVVDEWICPTVHPFPKDDQKNSSHQIKIYEIERTATFPDKAKSVESFVLMLIVNSLFLILKSLDLLPFLLSHFRCFHILRGSVMFGPGWCPSSNSLSWCTDVQFNTNWFLLVIYHDISIVIPK